MQHLLGLHCWVSRIVNLHILEFQVGINGEKYTLDHVPPEIKKLLGRLGFRSRAYSRFTATGSPMSQRSADHWFKVSNDVMAVHLLTRFLCSKSHQTLSAQTLPAFMTPFSKSFLVRTRSSSESNGKI
jgi:hypothetical protein